MLKNTLLLSTLLLLSGCAERGYQLTTNTKTNTITAESSVDIGNSNINIDTELNKMQNVVKKQRTKNIKRKRAEETITELKAREKRLKSKRVAKAADLKAEQLAKQKQKDLTQKDKIKAEKTVKGSEVKRFEAKRAEERMIQEAKLAKSLVAENIRKEKTAKIVEKYLAEQKALESKNAQILQHEAKVEEDKIPKQKILVKEKSLQEQNTKTHTLNNTEIQKDTTTFTQPLRFKLINKVFHKFGSSEIHGHVAYLNKGGRQLRLAQSKAYLLPVSATMNHWYNNFYLKNKTNSKSTTVNYLNSTYLNLEKNFNFYGVAEGSYYVVIEANCPSNMAKNKKVYVAKKIKVGKNKKIMAVFSKKI